MNLIETIEKEIKSTISNLYRITYVDRYGDCGHYLREGKDKSLRDARQTFAVCKRVRVRRISDNSLIKEFKNSTKEQIDG